MWDAIRLALFPPVCVGCGDAGTLACAACVPPARYRRHARVGDLDVVSTGAYEGRLRDAILALKRGERAALDALAPRLIAALAVVPVTHTLVPVPTTWWRRNRRGFDQAVVLARRAARAREAPFAELLVKRHGAQQGRGAAARRTASGRYRLRARVALPRVAVLIDDVATSGATLTDAAAVLRRAGVIVPLAVVLALAPGGASPASARGSERSS